MAKAKAKSDDPELEINAKLTGSDVKEWSKKWKKGESKKNVSKSDGAGGALYFVGFIGALIYWWQAAIGFGAVVTGFLKALVWPAYIVYKLLESFYGITN